MPPQTIGTAFVDERRHQTRVVSSTKPHTTGHRVVWRNHHWKNGLRKNPSGDPRGEQRAPREDRDREAVRRRDEREPWKPPLQRDRVVDVPRQEPEEMRTERHRPVRPRKVLRDRGVHAAGERLVLDRQSLLGLRDRPDGLDVPLVGSDELRRAGDQVGVAPLVELGIERPRRGAVHREADEDRSDDGEQQRERDEHANGGQPVGPGLHPAIEPCAPGGQAARARGLAHRRSPSVDAVWHLASEGSERGIT